MRTIGATLIGLVVAAPLAGCEPPDTTVRETPVAIIRETVGVGRPARDNDLVTINYRILTDDGREVLSEDGYRFIMGTGAVIEGIDDAVHGMQITGERVISCPPQLHWGRGGYGAHDVPANATLTIFVELEAID
ncbi:MAG: FKBP-type peptidyl-prolyl cis-trans isomerase [Planctomycetota bacterium]|jgi:FKBP-type peptidyl-prolyl cis-trans isomerase